MNEYDIKRAKYLLMVAADYIQHNKADGQIIYDGACCDGYCLSDDLRVAASQLTATVNDHD